MGQYQDAPFTPPRRFEQHGRPIAAREQTICEAEGHWSNFDVYVEGPSTWVTTPVTLKLWLLKKGGQHLIGSIDLSLSPASTRVAGGRAEGLVASVRGHPCDGFLVTATTGADVDAGYVRIEAWGTESTPVVATTIPRQGDGVFPAPLVPPPPVSAFLIGQSPGGNFGTVQVDAAQNVKVAEQFAPQAEDNTNGIIATALKPLAVATYTPTLDTNKGAVNARSLKAAAGNVFRAILENTNAAARFAFFVDTAGAPVAGSAAFLVPIIVPANAYLLVDFGPQGVQFPTGIGLAFMTTIAGGVLATAGETWWTVEFK